MSAGPRVLVSGYYGFGNAGDEAILGGLVEGFRELRPNAQLVVLSGDPSATAREHGVVAEPRGLRSAWRQARRCDLLLSGGGGLLQDVTSWRSPLYYLAVIELARAAGRPIACIGHSIGPLRRPVIRAMARRTLGRVGVIATRDERSREALHRLGLARQIHASADLAFLLPRPTDDEIAAARSAAGISGETGPVAAVAIRPSPAAAADSSLAERLGRAIGAACEGIGLRPLFVPMQPSQDLAFARAAADAFPSGGPIMAPALPARTLLALLAGCDLAIGMRLHALIFAAIGSVPLVAISYDPKVDGLMDQLGLSAATSLERLDVSALDQGIRDGWARRDETRRALAGAYREQRRAAARSIELALGLLPGGLTRRCENSCPPARV